MSCPKQCGTCERYEEFTMYCLYHEEFIGPDILACPIYIPEVNDA